jgi:hypothetical protein
VSDKATPRPWVTGPDLDNCGGGRNILADTESENSVRIAHTNRVVYGGEELVSEAEARANAELIVRAVNAHDDLVAALKGAESILWMAESYAEAGGSGGPEMREYAPVAEMIRAALAKAKS